MIDEITYYTDEKTGVPMKQVFREDSLMDTAKELAAIESQLADIEAGDAKDPSEDGAAAIVNYREQILKLKQMAKGA
tara:strand:- start:1559 stop:1789 length:231 start_codon:yes stop_codon:yes gene_type:complete